MRPITSIVIHCSATPEGRPHTVKDIDTWHRARGFAKIGYHYVIYLDGSVYVGRPEAEVGAHVSGHNATTIGICYVGGMDAANKHSKDTRTPAQIAAMTKLVRNLLKWYPNATVQGHRDFPGVAKDCPSFDAKAWWKSVTASPSKPEVTPKVLPKTYAVEKGDTLYAIAKRLGVDAMRLADTNGLVKPLAIGDVLKVPG